MPRKILDIDIDEISVVDAAANRRKFFIKKGAIQMDELYAALQSFLGADAVPKEKAEMNLSEEQIAEIKSAIEVLAKYKADYPDDVLAAVQSLLKSAIKASSDEVLSVEKIGARLSRVTREDLQKIRAIIDRLEPPEEAPAGADVEKAKSTGIAPEIAARLAKLDKIEVEEIETRKRAEQKAKDDLLASIAKLQTEIEMLKKARGASLQKKGEEAVDASDLKKNAEEAFAWPSLCGQEEN